MEPYPPNQQQPAPPPDPQGQGHNNGPYYGPGQNYPPPPGGYPPPYQQQPYGYPGPQTAGPQTVGPQGFGPKTAWLSAFQVICLVYAILLGMSCLSYLGLLVFGAAFTGMRVVAPGLGAMQMLFRSLVPAMAYLLLIAVAYIVLCILLYRAIKARRRSTLTLVLVLNIMMPVTNLLSIPFSRSLMNSLTMSLYMMMTELDIPLDGRFMTMMDRLGPYSIVYSVVWAAVVGGLLALNTVYFRKRRELFH